MTAAATRTGTSGRAKHALSASSKAAPEQDAAEETAASQPEGADEQREGVDEPTETVAVQPESVDGPTEVIAAQSESIAEQIEPSAAPVESVAALGEEHPGTCGGLCSNTESWRTRSEDCRGIAGNRPGVSRYAGREAAVPHLRHRLRLESPREQGSERKHRAHSRPYPRGSHLCPRPGPIGSPAAQEQETDRPRSDYRRTRFDCERIPQASRIPPASGAAGRRGGRSVRAENVRAFHQYASGVAEPGSGRAAQTAQARYVRRDRDCGRGRSPCTDGGVAPGTPLRLRV